MVIIFCGISGCGKTTIARALIKALAEKRGLDADQRGRKNVVKLFVSDELNPPLYIRNSLVFLAYDGLTLRLRI